MPVMSWLPTFANTTVNGTFLSPGDTSTFESKVPKYESRYLISPKSRSNGESPKPPKPCAKASPHTDANSSVVAKNIYFKPLPHEPY